MIPPNVEMTRVLETTLHQYETACQSYGEDSPEAQELLQRLEMVAVTSELRPDPQMNGNLPVRK
jgi:truncated hemoglobin YjbI